MDRRGGQVGNRLGLDCTPQWEYHPFTGMNERASEGKSEMDQDERLRLEPSNNTGQWRLHRSTNEYIGLIEDRALARRIVACVNACEGISTEALEHLQAKELARVLHAGLQIVEALTAPDDD